MAIDFMVMPLSRYLTGDFVTPAMEFAWSRGLAYSVLGPQGRRDVPQGHPFGGPDASAQRARFVPMLVDDLRALPATVGPIWDEASATPPTFHRVDPTSYGALVEEAAELASGDVAHVGATFFLPNDFATPFAMPVVFERSAGSAVAALRALETGGWEPEAQSARATLTDALRDAVRLKLPMIVDA